MRSFILIAFAAFLIVEMIVSAEGVDPSALQSETVLATDAKSTANSQSGLRGSSKDVITAMNPALAERVAPPHKKPTLAPTPGPTYSECVASPAPSAEPTWFNCGTTPKPTEPPAPPIFICVLYPPPTEQPTGGMVNTPDIFIPEPIIA